MESRPQGGKNSNQKPQGNDSKKIKNLKGKKANCKPKKKGPEVGKTHLSNAIGGGRKRLNDIMGGGRRMWHQGPK